MNIAQLRANLKHSPKSDSELVPRGKAEKYLYREVKRTSNLVVIVSYIVTYVLKNGPGS